MRKSDINARMADYLEGDLPLEDRALFDAYLDADPESAQDVAELRRTIALLRGLPDPSPPEDLTRRVMERIRAGEGRTPWWSRVGAFASDLFHPRFAGPALVGAAAAALVMLVVDGDLSIQRPDTAPGSTAEQVARAPRAVRTPAGEVVAGRPVATRPAVPAGVQPGVQAASQQPSPAGGVPALTRHTQVRIKTRTVTRTSPDAVRTQPGPPLPTPSTTPAPVTMVGTSPGAPARTVGPVGGMRASGPLGLGRAGSQSQAQPGPGATARPMAAASSAGDEDRADARLDERIAALLADPAGFAEQLGRDRLADIWVDQLVDRIQERQLADEVLRRLRETAAPEAFALADAFELELADGRAPSVAREEGEPAP